jgi:hypothetical protein
MQASTIAKIPKSTQAAAFLFYLIGGLLITLGQIHLTFSRPTEYILRVD